MNTLWGMVAGLAALLTVSAQLPVATTKPIDYVIACLKKSGKAFLADDFFEEKGFAAGTTFAGRWHLDDASHPTECSLQIKLKASRASDNGVAESTLTLRVNLGDAELEGISISGSKVVLRMAAAATVINSLWLLSFQDAKELKSESSDKWFKVPLPTFDDEDARRLSRALNQQIKTCGGKRDPFAK